MELGPEDVSLLERCPHFRGWYVQASMELGPEDMLGGIRYVQASMKIHTYMYVHYSCNLQHYICPQVQLSLASDKPPY